MKKLIIGTIATSALLVGCGEKSMYKDEGDKLETYAIETAKKLNEAITESNVPSYKDSVEINYSEYRSVAGYISLYTKGIKTSKLNEKDREFYEESLDKLKVYEDMLDAAHEEKDGYYDFVSGYEMQNIDRFGEFVSDYYGKETESAPVLVEHITDK